MTSWKMLAVSVVILGFCAGVDKALPRINWWLDGHLAIADAKDALEYAGVADVDENVRDIAPDFSHQVVAGHVRTTGGTQPFFVQFAGCGRQRVPVKVTVGSKTLIPRTNRHWRGKTTQRTEVTSSLVVLPFASFLSGEVDSEG